MLKETQKCKCACSLPLAAAGVCDCKIARMPIMARSMIVLGKTKKQICMGQLICGRFCQAQAMGGSHGLLVQLSGLWRCLSERQVAVR